jgi:octaprenyl-diphosphate synthase
LRAIRSKTAKLFEASARIAALLAEITTLVEMHCAASARARYGFSGRDDVLVDGDVGGSWAKKSQ